MEYLYHYTNIESLALILKNRTIRFNSLDKMDDLQEQETGDIKNAGQFCYVSSWTEDDIESIPMWNLYSSLDAGVRIKLRKFPFKEYENTIEALSAVTKTSVATSDGNSIKSIIPLTEILSKGFFSPQAMGKQDAILFKVEYTQDAEKLYPKLHSNKGEDSSLAFGKLGKFKNVYWSFQKEWRYILYFLPMNINQSPQNIFKNLQLMANRLFLGLEKQPFPHYDMFIDDEAFFDMEITLSPKISMGNRTIVENLIDKYNPQAIIKDSTLLGLI